MFESLTRRLEALNLRVQGGDMRDGVWYRIEDVKQRDGEGQTHLLMDEGTAGRLLRQAYHGDSPPVDNGIGAVECMVTSSNTFEVRAKIGFAPSREPRKILRIKVECYIEGDPKFKNDKRIRGNEWRLKTDSGIWIDGKHRHIQHSDGGQHGTHGTITQPRQNTPPPIEKRHHEGSRITHGRTMFPFSDQHGPNGSGDIYGQPGANHSQLSLPHENRLPLLHDYFPQQHG